MSEIDSISLKFIKGEAFDLQAEVAKKNRVFVLEFWATVRSNNNVVSR